MAVTFLLSKFRHVLLITSIQEYGISILGRYRSRQNPHVCALVRHLLAMLDLCPTIMPSDCYVIHGFRAPRYGSKSVCIFYRSNLCSNIVIASPQLYYKAGTVLLPWLSSSLERAILQSPHTLSRAQGASFRPYPSDVMPATLEKLCCTSVEGSFEEHSIWHQLVVETWHC